MGISHLTTSRRHLAKPVLTAEAIPGGFRLNGMSPWVTGGAAADVMVLAATLVERGEADRSATARGGADGSARIDESPIRCRSIGVSASSTGPVHLDRVEVSDEWLIAGPGRERDGERHRGEHGRIRNVDAGDRRRPGGDRLSGR